MFFGGFGLVLSVVISVALSGFAELLCGMTVAVWGICICEVEVVEGRKDGKSIWNEWWELEDSEGRKNM